MKTEKIIELIKNHYRGSIEFNNYLIDFIQQLRSEGFLDTVNEIEKIKSENTKIAVNKIPNRKKENLFSEQIQKDMNVLISGYKMGIVRNVLLKGKPGTGKTSFIKLLADKMNLKLIDVSLSAILDSRLGESIKNIESIMNIAIEEKSILFFDEADSLFRTRYEKNDLNEISRILNTMLKKLDTNQDTLIIFATNLYDDIDKSIKRRMDLVINFDQYSHNELIDIYKLYAKRYKLKDEYFKNISEFIKKYEDQIVPSDIEILSKRLSLISLLNKPIDEILEQYKEYYK